MPFPQRVIPARSDIPDVYQGNTQNILQKAAVSNMIGVLTQLNKISVFASEIFTDILTTTQANSARIKKVRSRLSRIESRVEPTEKMFTNNSPSFFYDNPYPGKEWQRKDPLRGLLFRRDRANAAVNTRRSVGLPLPDLSSLDRISVDGECIKKYSDSNFFMNEWLEAEKKKMEEEKAKRRERKKKRKKRKRQQQEKITGIERWVYDPITGKKIKKKAAEIAVTKYELTDSNIAANIDFESSDVANRDRMATINASQSKVAQMAKKQQRVKSVKKKAVKKAASNLSANRQHQHGGPSYAKLPQDDIKQSMVPISPSNARTMNQRGKKKPPPVPFENTGKKPPPIPVIPGGGPPPVPGGNEGEGKVMMVPPPVPTPEPVKKKLTGAEMAALSASRAEASGAYQKPQKAEPAPLVPMASNALLAGIRGGVKLKQTTQVKREPKMDQRDMLLAALKNKGQSGLKKMVREERKSEEKVEATIFAILNRRQFMADDSDSESGSTWSSDD